MISLVLPTYNEAASIVALIDTIDGVLQSVPHEIIIVDDDSPDGTWRVAESLVTKHPTVRVLRRVGRRGLSSAVVEGFDMARGNTLAVMDADGQHDAVLLLAMLASLKEGAELVIGSRYMPGGSVGEWVRDRRIISSIGTVIARTLSRVKVSDPLGGFFALRASLYAKVRPSLQPTGFKILLEILAHIPPSSRVVEIPLIFRMRLHGQSKLSLHVHVAFLWQSLRLTVRRFFLGACTLCVSVFWIASAIIALVLVFKLQAMHRLYTQSTIRAAVQEAITEVSARQGWLISDIEIVSVGTDRLTIRHREHMRRAPPPKTCVIGFTPYSLTCENTQS